MKPPSDFFLGQAALARGFLSQAQLDAALAAQAQADEEPLARLFVRMRLLTEAQVRTLEQEVEAMKARTAGGGAAHTIVEPSAPSDPEKSRTAAQEARTVRTQAGGAAPSDVHRRSAAALEGGRFGKYRLDERIGQGGMGTVYRAFDTELNRTVAVKVLLGADDGEEERVKRFQREAETAGKLRHPNIVTIYQVGCEGGHHYFAMEYIEGTDLSHLIRDQKLTLEAAIEIFLQVAEAVDHAHRHKVVHRDLKPQNIMVDPEGRACVTDFGLAKSLDARTRLTQTGKLLGTPMYMAPEQANAEAGRVDPLTDIYALGAILYEILSGKPPFDGDSPAEIVYAVLFKDPVPPTKLNRRIPQDLETICLKALEKEKPRRYATAKEMADDLRRWREGEPIHAKPVGSFSRVLRRVRRHRGAFLGGVAALLVAGLALGYAFVYARESAEHERLASEQEAKNRAEREAMEKQRQAREAAAGLIRQAAHEEPPKALELCTQAIAQDPQSVAAYAARAKILDKLGREADAVADYGKALELEPGNVQILYERGQIFAWSLHETEKAAADFRAILERDPENVLALEGQGCILLFQSRNVEATKQFTRVIEKDPSRWGGYYFRATAEAVGHDYPAAIADLTAALEHKPDDPVRLLVDRAKYNNWSLEAAPALADAEQALRLNPRLASALMEKGIALGLLGRQEEAVKAGEEGVALDPGNAEILARLTQVYRSGNDFDKVVEAAGRALAVNPKCIMALTARAQVREAQAKYDEAIADCDAILADGDLWHDAHMIKGEALLGKGDLDGARQELDRAVGLEPDEPNGYMARSRVHKARGDLAAMQGDLQKYIDLMSARRIDSAPYHVVLGRAMAMAERWEDALSHYTKAIDRDPTMGEAYENRAVILVKVGQLPLARKDAETYVRLCPGDFAAHRLQALIHLIAGEFPDAVKAYERAIELRPAGTVEIWNNLAHAYNMMKQPDAAVKALERGLALDPAEEGLLYNLSCLQCLAGRKDEALASLAKAIAAGYEHFAQMEQDPDLDVLRASEAFAPAVADACVERAKRVMETGRSVESYAPAQAKVDYDRSVALLGYAVKLSERIASRSAKSRIFWERSNAWRYLHARDKEIADLEVAAKLDDEYEGRWHHAVGLKDLDEGRPADAVREFTTAIGLEPDLAAAYCDRGAAKLQMDDKEGARTDLEEGFKKRPELKAYYQTAWKKAKGER